MKKQDMAFPSEALGQTGMTLRDWFAGMALSGIHANGKNERVELSLLAESAYEQADYMLMERNK
jgi:hypothetical protein